MTEYSSFQPYIYVNAMPTYQHILLAVDFSEQDEFVVQKARALANCYHAKLSIIHVLDNIPMPDTSYGAIIALDKKSDNEMLENEKAKLINLAKHLHVDMDDLWLVWGVPKQEINNIAEQIHADLIVVGAHGRHGIALLLGSTANSVLHHAPCDVLAVHLPAY